MMASISIYYLNSFIMMYQELFYQTLDICKSAGTCKHRFKSKNKLLSLDSSIISLYMSLFPWAKFRRTKGTVKLRLLLDNDGYLPDYAQKPHFLCYPLKGKSTLHRYRRPQFSAKLEHINRPVDQV